MAEYNTKKLKKILALLNDNLDKDDLRLLGKAVLELLKFREGMGFNADADDDKGQWITTENKHHVHLNEGGEPDKGNKHVIEKMKSGGKKKSGINSTPDDGGAGGNSGGGGGGWPPPDDTPLGRLARNETWAAAYENAKKLTESAFPKDPEYAYGENRDGKMVELKIQGKEAQQLYYDIQHKVEYSIEELKANPVVKQMDEVSKKISEALGDTSKINTPERKQMREEILSEFLSTGSPIKDKETEEYTMTGPIEKGFKAVIYTGLPAAGKSTAVNKDCAGMFVLDSDAIKDMLPEFQATGGASANANHKESKDINQKAMAAFLSGDRNGDNVVIPIIGDDSESVYNKYIEKLEAAGYDVEVRGIDATPEKSANRVVGRAIETGRIIPSEVVLDYGTKCDTAYDALKNMKNQKGESYVKEKKRKK